jgi:hypothetical protein
MSGDCEGRKSTLRPAFSNLQVLICFGLFCAMAIAAQATTIIVSNTNDSGPGSLRQALANANNGDTINFAVTGTISLYSGELVIGKNVTIAGPGANRLSIDGGQELGSPTPEAAHMGLVYQPAGNLSQQRISTAMASPITPSTILARAKLQFGT